MITLPNSSGCIITYPIFSDDIDDLEDIDV